MKKLITLFALLICLTNLKAQFVTIPDANFVAWLQANVPSAMSGNMMDTTSLAVTTRTIIVAISLGITDITGVQYFDGLKMLYCQGNNIIQLPNLPHSISFLHCGGNQLTSLPNIPSSLKNLQCQWNQLSNLPHLPDSLTHLECDNNNISCFERFPNTIESWNFQLQNNPFKCLPNYIDAMNNKSFYLNYPLCVVGDTINNPNNCSDGANIIGSVFNDLNLDCQKNPTEQVLNNIPIKLYKNNTYFAQTSTQNNGYYSFASDTGTYSIIIDTINKPYKIQCSFPGIDTILYVNTSTILSDSINFLISSKLNYTDISVQSISHTGIVFPAVQHTLNVTAGDLKKWYNLDFTPGNSGTISFSVSGPVTYMGPAVNSLAPSISGNVYTYNIPDFGLINNANDFKLIFQTNTNAQSGDSICVYATVTSNSGDNNPTNNIYNYCYCVVNSRDPNIKEVYPINVQPGFNDWLTYTVHFQNTGNAPAFNVRLSDTLDNVLDLETFQVINYSHPNVIDLTGNILNVRFPNIQLPDSISNSAGSIGFIQYRIKPKSTWVATYKIKNKAYIYFDYNNPIVTNTTYNSILTATGLNNQSENVMALYPNPNNGTFTVELNTQEKQLIQLFDVTGNLVLSQNMENGKATIDANHLSAGIYYISIKGNGVITNKKLVIVK